MADSTGTIIDSFLVEVGLDPKKYEEGRKKIVEDNKRLRDDSLKTAKGMEDNSRKAAGGVSQLRGEVMRLTLAFAGAASITSFVQGMVKSDAATGRLAGNIGMLTGELGAWEGAIQRVGGKAGDADAALQAMSRAWWDFQLTGKTSNDADLKALGVTPKDLQNPADALLKISEASEKMGRPEFVARLQRIGLPESTINLLQKGRAGVEALLEEQKKLAPVTEENARKAQEFEAKLAKLKSSIEGQARPAVSELVDVVIALDDTIGLVNISIPLMGAALGLLVAGPVGAAIGAFAILIGKAGLLKQIMDDIQSGDLIKFKNEPAPEGDLAGKTSSFMEDITGGSLFNFRREAPPPPGGGSAPSRYSPRAANMAGMSNQVLKSGTGGTDPEIYRALASKYGSERALGITAGIYAEGGTTGMAANGAFGIGQWRGSRQKELFRRYGRAPTKQQQLEYLMWELEGGDKGGASVLASKDRRSALSNYIGGYGWGFMRPSTRTDNSGRVGDMRRGNSAIDALERGGMRGGTNVNIGSMTINTKATDANGIARDINASIGRRVTINQVNGGLS